MKSLQKAIEKDDFAYMCSYLVYYEDEEELQRTMTFLDAQKDEKNQVVFTEKEKQRMLDFLADLEESLGQLKPTSEDRFVYEVEHAGELFYFQSKNGAWKINPRSSRIVKHEIKIPARF